MRAMMSATTAMTVPAWLAPLLRVREDMLCELPLNPE